MVVDLQGLKPFERLLLIEAFNVHEAFQDPSQEQRTGQMFVRPAGTTVSRLRTEKADFKRAIFQLDKIMKQMKERGLEQEGQDKDNNPFVPFEVSEESTDGVKSEAGLILTKTTEANLQKVLQGRVSTEVLQPSCIIMFL